MISCFQNLDISMAPKKPHRDINLVHFSITTASLVAVKPATTTLHTDSVQADCRANAVILKAY